MNRERANLSVRGVSLVPCVPCAGLPAENEKGGLQAGSGRGVGIPGKRGLAGAGVTGRMRVKGLTG